MQTDYSQRFDISRPGFLSGLGTPRVRAFRNTSANLASTWTLTPVDATAINTEYLYAAVPVGQTYDPLVHIPARFVTAGSGVTQAGTLAGIVAAIRNSPIYDLAYPVIVGSDVKLVARSVGAISYTLYTTTTTTVVNTVVGGSSTPVPFGRYVARRSTDEAGEARLPTATTDKLVGVTLSTYAAEKDQVGPNAKTEYKPSEIMDVLDRCNTVEGIWIECVGTVGINDTLYVSVSGADAGKITTVSSGTIAVTAASLIEGTKVNSDGTRMVLLSVNLP